ncbi:MAG: ubiquinone biosynthesis regulatory protein kinase UbiB [Xanthomonadales bacterium]|nr:ubiquinone biosynthesis regulatory protein kinase UbiB [Gammaproteobacteria bacterium]MBT8054754.1 ubiquinone biosynthesis regulatory protein kinase UbiB [Gammaproteobacteria bacterium]NND58547.1 ubiquinone biosynthesis regulatory protein kinase UbiB [Xanthomonadales bacterium]NNK52241.1 ubiquinone biosynthesis regulatory protein kinase UbiB [Xanthomonadales bacterium]
MHSLRQFTRMLKISAILSRYRLDEFLEATHLYRPMRLLRVFAPWGKTDIADKPRGERLRLALNEMGPIYVKFGQIISTRRDLVAPDIADELALLQDQVPPFPGHEARSIIENALNQPVEDLFGSFDLSPLASASIAQVHAATLPDGSEVVVKVVRPGINRLIRRDIDLLMAVARLAEKYWEGGSRVKPTEFVREFETFIFDELDMTREGANASALRANFEGSKELYIPEIYWPYCKEQVLVMERVSGIPISDVKGLKDAGVNLERLAEMGIRVFYTQVFRDNLFHADMHPGNILVDVSDPENASYIALDFGIVASLTPLDLYYISENFQALFNRDYFRVAQLHIDAGWVPHDTRVDELEASVRAVGEPSFARPLNEVSFGNLMLKLFQVAYRFKLDIQPQLIMLQKTLLNIEGLGRDLYPELDVLAVSKPELERILREKHGIDQAAKDLRERLPGWLSKAPEMPGLLHDYLKLATEGKLISKTDPRELARIQAEQRAASRRIVRVVSGAALFFSGATMAGLEVGPWFFYGGSAAGLVSMVVGAWLLIQANRD